MFLSNEDASMLALARSMTEWKLNNNDSSHSFRIYTLLDKQFIIDNNFYTQELIQIEKPLFSSQNQNGTIPFEPIVNSNLQIYQNPDIVGPAETYQFKHTGNNHDGVQTVDDINFDKIDFTATPYLKVKVYVPKPITIACVFQFKENPDDQESKIYMIQEESETGQWIELTFDFTGVTSRYDRLQLLFEPDLSGNYVNEDIYFDDFIMSKVD